MHPAVVRDAHRENDVSDSRNGGLTDDDENGDKCWMPKAKCRRVRSVPPGWRCSRCGVTETPGMIPSLWGSGNYMVNYCVFFSQGEGMAQPARDRCATLAVRSALVSVFGKALTD